MGGNQQNQCTVQTTCSTKHFKRRTNGPKISNMSKVSNNLSTLTPRHEALNDGCTQGMTNSQGLEHNNQAGRVIQNLSRVLESSRCALRCPFKRPTNRGNPKLESTKSEGFLSFFLTNEQTNNELQTACSSVSDESMDDCFVGHTLLLPLVFQMHKVVMALVPNAMRTGSFQS